MPPHPAQQRQIEDMHRPIACPYASGSRLLVQFTPEGEHTSYPLYFSVTKAFTPFTSCQVLLVETDMYPRLPRRLVLKLVDPRFTEPGSEPDLGRTTPWTPATHQSFITGLTHVRNGEWPNYWSYLGPITGDVTRPIPEDLHDSENGGWYREMEQWANILATYDKEVSAYRALSSLQGTRIPRLYGTCQYAPTDTSLYMDPIMATVNGLALEYIDGVAMDKLEVGKSITLDAAERVSLAIIDTVRRVRNLRVIHGDIARRNILVRQDDPDHPVLIDFGSAGLKPSDRSDEDWVHAVSGFGDIRSVRYVLEEYDWHIPSPRRGEVECCHSEVGYMYANRVVDNMKEGQREKYFDRVPDVPPDEIRIGEDGKVHRWEHLRWRLKNGARTRDEDFDWRG
ncbi:uncharacterized protein STEHIDRAFT_155239 [Stereum hirsutum FP-91666 SS1]|uniref:uncharacterized protein n=1 Tax=Stereum hirsutum (strain FP-91666) TaxID=721885 RepID=UPI0004409DA5|nr:uncharacterized protein STEHIDRAFT_155239 [Stereum hirsutum FP-91666 SS1]EIM87876.1 hypothetical protein STEHIDRAFT_155239 [Stereum hirsutum FP-91666 SS1]